MKPNNFINQFKHHTTVLLNGLGRTLYGAFITSLLVTACYGFWLIKGESGYAAVFDFIASIALLFVAFCNVYLLGGKRKGGKK